MNILITGGTGFIGSHTVVELLENNYRCIIVDNLVNSSRDVVERICQITGKKNLEFKNIDLCNCNNLELIFRDYKIEGVIHFAGLKAVGESVMQPVNYYENNIVSTLNLLKMMKKYEVKKLIFSSSATVYGNAPVPMTEQSAIGNGITNPYGMTKYMIELILKDFCKSDPSFKIMSLRYFNPVGAHPSGLIGENPNNIPNNLMPFLLKVAYQNNLGNFLGEAFKEVKIFGNDYDTRDGTGLRDYIHVVDLAKAHVKAYEKLGEGYDYVNLGTGEGTTVLEMIEIFEKVNNVKIPYTIVERRDGDLAKVYCNPLKAKELLGWVVEKSLEDMCRDSWNFQKKNFL